MLKIVSGPTGAGVLPPVVPKHSTHTGAPSMIRAAEAPTMPCRSISWRTPLRAWSMKLSVCAIVSLASPLKGPF